MINPLDSLRSCTDTNATAARRRGRAMKNAAATTVGMYNVHSCLYICRTKTPASTEGKSRVSLYHHDLEKLTTCSADFDCLQAISL